MSITICDIKVPADYCSPVIMRLAERFEALRDQYAALDEKYEGVTADLQQAKKTEERLKKQVADLKKQVEDLKKPAEPKPAETAPTVVVSELTDADISAYKLEDWAAEWMVQEIGAEVSIRDVWWNYREWVTANCYKKSVNKKHLTAFLVKKYGDPVDPGKVMLAGVRLKEESEA